MKTLCLAAALLLLLVCDCGAMPWGTQLFATPTSCCFKFSTRKAPLQNVQDVFNTSPNCSKKAIIVKTQRGNLCYAQSFQWAQDLHREFHSARNRPQEH